MSRRVLIGLTTAGFVASALLHLATFSRLLPVPGDALPLALFALAFVPLAAMLLRLYRSTVAARGASPAAGARSAGWRALGALVPPGARMLIVATVLYALMNLVLSLMLTGGVTAEARDGRHYLVEDGRRREVSREEYDAHRQVTLRLLSGHLLLFYLVPLTYFRFVEPQLPSGPHP